MYSIILVAMETTRQPFQVRRNCTYLSYEVQFADSIYFADTFISKQEFIHHMVPVLKKSFSFYAAMKTIPFYGKL